MKDSFGREIRYLRISVTNRCNFKCRYCKPVTKASCPAAELSPDQIAGIACAAADLGIEKIRLTGGEPLMRGDLEEMISRIRKIPGIRELALTTNGSMLAARAEGLREAGLDRVNVSLDTLKPDRFRQMAGSDDLDRVLDGIAQAVHAGLTPVKINTVLIGGFNEDEVGALAAYAASFGGKAWLRFIELMPIGPCADWPREMFPDMTKVVDCLAKRFSEGLADKAAEILPNREAGFFPNRAEDSLSERLSGLRHTGKDGVSSLYESDDGQLHIGLIQPVSQSFCSRCDRIRLTSDGFIQPCLHGAWDQRIAIPGEMPEPREVIRERIRQAIEAKPYEHRLQEGRSDSPRCMNEIGG